MTGPFLALVNNGNRGSPECNHVEDQRHCEEGRVLSVYTHRTNGRNPSYFVYLDQIIGRYLLSKNDERPCLYLRKLNIKATLLPIVCGNILRRYDDIKY